MCSTLQRLVVVIRSLLVAGISLAGYCSAIADVSETIVFQSGQDGYHTFRIPAIVAMQNGDLLAFAEGRKNGAADHGDIDIVLKHSSDGGKTWSPMYVVADEWQNSTANVTIGNPVPVLDVKDPNHRGRVWLAFARNNAAVFVTYSDDRGHTWSQPRDVSVGASRPGWSWYATGPGHGIQLERGPHAGRLIIPCDHRDGARDAWGAHILYSDDHGATWTIGAVDTHAKDSPLHPNENLAVELVDGRIYVNARDQHGADPATRAVAYSNDGGLTFDTPFAAEPGITTPVVQNSILRLAATDRGDPNNLLVDCCPGHPTKRRDLTILVSDDEGKTWPSHTVIHAGPAAYSDLVKLDTNKFGVLFEAGPKLYDQIIFAAVALDDLEADAAPASSSSVPKRIAKPAKFVTRAEWGSQPDPIPESRRHTPKWITIHHAGVLWTNTQDPAQFVRNLQTWGKKRPQIEHPPRDTYWPDLAYHFLIAPDGRIFEGRPTEFEPESNTKYSLAGNIGVEMMGDFERQRPSLAQLESLVRLTAWQMQEHHIAIENVRSHRDAAPGQTSCPGRDVYRHLKGGQLRNWLYATLNGEVLEIDPGPPLPDGPTERITDTRPSE